MSEMIERVARALCVEDGHDPEGDDCWNFGRSHDIQRKNWEAYTGGARAAIEAMREPTEGMKQSGAMVMPDYDPDVNDAAQCWEAMINEALK